MTFVTVNTSGYDPPDVTGIFDTAEEAELFLCGSLVDAGAAEDEEEARILLGHCSFLWAVPMSEPSPTSLTRG